MKTYNKLDAITKQIQEIQNILSKIEVEKQKNKPPEISLVEVYEGNLEIAFLQLDRIRKYKRNE